LTALAPAVSLSAPGDVSDQPDAVAVDETPTLWLVELSGKASIDGGNVAALAAEKQAFRSAAENAGVRLNERRSFQTLWNGVSVSIKPGDVTKLARVPGVKAIYPVIKYSVPERSPNPGIDWRPRSSRRVLTSRRTSSASPAPASRSRSWTPASTSIIRTWAAASARAAA
jgi:hypothetical protein